MPGGFLEPGESPQTGTLREVMEELNVTVQLGELLGVYMDFYGDSSYDYTLNFYYMGTITAGTIVAADDMGEAHWFNAADVPVNLVFAHDRDIMADWKKLRVRRLHGVSSLRLREE